MEFNIMADNTFDKLLKLKFTHKQETLVKEGESSFFLRGVFSSTTKKGDQVNIYYKKQSKQKVLSKSIQCVNRLHPTARI